MAEAPAPVLSATSWAQCTCKPCETRRRVKQLLSGCPCKECQPGDGIDYARHLSARRYQMRKRLTVLLEKNDRGALTPAEETELDSLCSGYLFGT